MEKPDIKITDPHLSHTDKDFLEVSLRRHVKDYYDGVASPEQIKILSVAAGYASNGRIAVADPLLASDLQLIAGLDSYALASLSDMETKMPADLDSRFSTHVSGLATASRMKWRRLKTISAAAACVAILIAAGVRFMGKTPDGFKDSNPTEILIAAAPRPGLGYTKGVDNHSASLVPNEGAESLSSSYPFPVKQTNAHLAKEYPLKPGQPNSNDGNHIVRIAIPEPVAQISVGTLLAAEKPGVDPILDLSSENPMTSFAENVSEALSLPLSEVKESMESMIRTLNVVNAAFYEARKTTTSVSEDVTLASILPLRSI